MATINGDADANELIGGGDDDTITGFGGADTLTGGLGLDFLFGGGGADMLIIADPTEAVSGETYYGGAGIDTLRLEAANSSTLNADLRNADIQGIERIEIASSGTTLTTVLRVDADDFGAGIALDAVLSLSGSDQQNERVSVRMNGATDLDLSNIIVEGARPGVLGDGFAVTGGGGVINFIGSVTNDSVTDTGEGTTLNGGRGNDYLSHAGGTATQTLGARGNDWIDSLGTSGVMAGNNGNDRVSFDYGVSPGVGATISGGAGVDLFELRADGNANFDLSGAEISGFESFKLDQRRPAPDLDYQITIEAEQLLTGFTSDATVKIISGRANLIVVLGDEDVLDLSGLIFGTSDITTEVSGGGGAQTLTGGSVADVFSGGGGQDTLRGNGGADDLTGGDGDDVIFGGSGEDRLVGGNGNDALGGGNNADTLIGGRGRDDVSGGNGIDDLFGSIGKDTLNGGKGGDTLTGGTGQDMMTGGDGADRFQFHEVQDSATGSTTRDTIADLQASDRIVFLNFDGDTTQEGVQQLTFIGNTAFSGTAGELRVRASSDGASLRLLADTDGDGAAEFEVLLSGVTSFDANLDLIY